MALSESPFQRRLAARREFPGVQPKVPSMGWLEVSGLVAQISLAVVAIFGYFYTVLPVYQKERLAEQVAEYEGIIRRQAPRVLQIEKQLAGLERERSQLTAELQRERIRLTTELKSIEHKLSLAREEKSRIEDQIQFMTYRYRLPDGRPATTREQVKTAQEADLRNSFHSTVYASCTFGSGPLFGLVGPRVDTKVPTYPFTEEELKVWQEHGTKYPLRRTLDCIESTNARYLEKYAQNFSPTLIESFRTEATQKVTQAASKPWTTPVEPVEVIKEIAARRAEIEKERIAELKKNEEEYGNWESVILVDRRIIYKHNYEVGKTNVDRQAISKNFSANYDAEGKAGSMRKAITEEVRRLVNSIK